MAREFSRKIYKSKEWVKCRDTIFKKYFGLCAECGRPGEEVHHIEFLTPYNINDPNIVFGEDNLILLCRDCHFNKHRETNPKFPTGRKPVTNKGMYFDDEGNLVQSKVYIVYGAPGSGKSRYVKTHKKFGDLVVDLDLIKEAISLENRESSPDNLLEIAFKVRDFIYNIIENRQYDCKNVWVIASLPGKKYREVLKEKLKAELVFMQASINECIDRVMEDTNRKDKELQKKIVEKWFANYEA